MLSSGDDVGAGIMNGNISGSAVVAALDGCNCPKRMKIPIPRPKQKQKLIKPKESNCINFWFTIMHSSKDGISLLQQN
ncbi:riboflavin synthase subunit alpha [Nostoc cycadae WK-1]|uniref:Riboflavin synthase subunit alpha n=1 Tax=Nostoc cycadae WK-1 TaxID=1861711 RepID=A0A2H6LMN3_9NOSO|nr:riboflavin synthase subunit alpha [Nostoc cycadae WK-1]